MTDQCIFLHYYVWEIDLGSCNFIYLVPDSPWVDLVSRQIIYLHEHQQITKLYNKWWKEKSGGKCDVEEKSMASALGVKHVGGVFVVLVGGLALGMLLACLEFMWKAKKNAKIDKVGKTCVSVLHNFKQT